MTPDRLQQLRDIHVPDPPGLWPPAPGWWLLGVIVIAAAVYAAWRLGREAQRRRPIRHARVLYTRIHQRHCQGELSAEGYLNGANELLKRLLIHAFGDDAARHASGDDWLRLLDRYAGEAAFSEGAGRALGDDRFRPGAEVDVEALHGRIEALLQKTLSQRAWPVHD
jgi:hypothetical protein